MADAKPTGIVGTHAEAETEGTELRKAEHKRSLNLRKLGLIAILTVAGIYAGYQIFPAQADVSGGFTLSLGGRIVIGILIYLMAKSIAKLLHILGLLEKDKEESTITLVKAAGVLTILLSLVFSGFGTWASRSIDRIEACAGDGDCEMRVEDIKTIRDGGSIRIPRGATKSFYILGTVTVTNFEHCHYLAYDTNMFDVVPRAGGRHNDFTAYSGKKELAVVTSTYDHDDPDC